MTTFQLEPYDKISVEGKNLFDKHWEQIAEYKDKRKLSVDYNLYKTLAVKNRLLFYTMRDDTGVLVGYSLFILSYAGHYQLDLQATNDILFILPEYRKGLTGYKFIKWCEEQLRHVPDLKFIIWRTKSRNNFNSLLERLGYMEEEISYSKYIGDN